MPLCAKMISSWVGKLLGIAKTHMFPGILQSAAVSTAMGSVVSLVSILQAGDWARVSAPPRHCFSTYMTTTDWHQDSVQHTVLDLSE